MSKIIYRLFNSVERMDFCARHAITVRSLLFDNHLKAFSINMVYENLIWREILSGENQLTVR